MPLAPSYLTLACVGWFRGLEFVVGSPGGAAHSQKGLLLAWDLECVWQPFLLRILLFPEQAEGSVRSAARPQSSQSACSQALPPQASSVPSPLGEPTPALAAEASSPFLYPSPWPLPVRLRGQGLENEPRAAEN